ncbi:hypothetical protein BGX31_000317 [Mortierella sp. GBA43]|nr:hypothetical protein BGX31_000317 [Mortierella sp. GBA43]
MAIVSPATKVATSSVQTAHTVVSRKHKPKSSTNDKGSAVKDMEIDMDVGPAKKKRKASSAKEGDEPEPVDDGKGRFLHKRDAYREAYDNFDYYRIADTYTSPASNERLLQTNIVKNRLKVEASMINAKAFKALLQELYPDQARLEDENGFWQFLQGYKMTNKKGTKAESPQYLTSNEASDRLSADLKKRGFKFVGTTIMYSYLQAVGIELEGTHHSSDCFMHSKNTRNAKE